MLPAPDRARWTAAFDQVWQTLKSHVLRDAVHPPRRGTRCARSTGRARSRRATSAQAEQVIDQMIAEQPLIKAAVESPRGVVASGHPLASAAGALVLAQGGNVVDAGIAVSFALGVVEPDASSIGGDGQAILFLKGMTEPVVIEYKDMTPSRATPDNPKLFTPTGGRTAPDGPTRRQHSRRRRRPRSAVPEVRQQEGRVGRSRRAGDQARRRGLRPRRSAADDDRAGTRLVREVSRVGEDLPAGRPRAAAGDRFVNKDYAETLRTIAKEGGQSFYRGIDRQAHRRRHGGERRRDHGRGSRAVPRDGAQAAGGPVSRPPRVFGAGAGLHRPADRRDAADPRQLRAARRRDLHDRCRLLPSRDRGLARARRRRAHRRSRTLSGGSRQSPRAGARARAVQADRSEEGVRRDGRRRGGGPARRDAPDAPDSGRSSRIRRDACRRARRRSSSPTPKAT